MKKYILGAILSLGIFLSPTFAPQAEASGLTSSQVQAILAILSSFGADSATIASVTTALTGTAPATGGSSFCHTFNTDLSIGSTLSEVSALHKALIKENLLASYYVDDNQFEGYGSFGESTATAVVSFQAKYNILQTGYVGPLTRAKLNSLYGCTNPPAHICPSDAKVCSDGTVVGRTGSSCSFSCPATTVTAPTATFTVNGGQKSVTVKVGDALTKTWGSTNGSSYDATWSATGTCTSGDAGKTNQHWLGLDGGAGTTGTKASGTESYAAQANQAGCTYTVTYVVTGATGTTPARSSIDIAIVATGTLLAPSAPTLSSVTAGNGSATLNFIAPTNTGGSTITSYVSSCGTQAATGGSPTVVTGLTNGTQYSCTVKAVNAVGTSAASNAINVTPTSIVAGTSAPICTITVNKSVLTDKEPIVLSWDTQNTVAATLTGTGIDSPGFDALRQKAYGTYPFRIFSLGASATYTLTVKNAAGTSATCSTPTITVVSASLRQSVVTTTSDGTTGQPFTLSWNSSNIGACKLTKTVTPIGGAEGAPVVVACYSADTNSYGDAFHTNGSCQPTPIVAGTHKFTFTCGSTVGKVSESVTHTVMPAPTATLTQSSTKTNSNGTIGQTFTVSWASPSGTSSCTLQKTVPDGTVTNQWATGTSGSKQASPYQVGTHHWRMDCNTGVHAEMDHVVVSGTVSMDAQDGKINQTASALNALSSATSADTDRTTTSNAAGFSYVWNRDLQIGSPYTSDVSALQTALARESVYAGEITGGFYDQTYIAVRKFQQKYGIKESGYAGMQTRAKLNALYSK